MEMTNDLASQYFISKKVSLIILAVTAMICSRTLLYFFHDPEGPNLVVVTGLALFIYALSLAAYRFGPIKINGIARLLAVIGLQLVLVTGLYFVM